MTPDDGTTAEYDAFLSYAHRDRHVTSAIQKGLHQIGRRLGRLRALRVFRDDTNLTASPDLWGRITEALDRSRYMIVVLSPQSAASHWVNEEIGHWLAHRGHERLMLVLAEGQLQWDAAEQRFDPQHSDAAPAVLTQAGSLPAEPLYIDVTDDAPWGIDGTLRLWSTTVGQPMRATEEHLYQAAFSPNGRRIAALGDAAIVQWDSATGQPLASARQWCAGLEHRHLRARRSRVARPVRSRISQS